LARITVSSNQAIRIYAAASAGHVSPSMYFTLFLVYFIQHSGSEEVQKGDCNCIRVAGCQGLESGSGFHEHSVMDWHDQGCVHTSRRLKGRRFLYKAHRDFGNPNYIFSSYLSQPHIQPNFHLQCA
jgi:hypothetical protein